MKKSILALFVLVAIFGISIEKSRASAPDYANSIASIDTFLSNPTSGNLKAFCSSSTDVLSSSNEAKNLCESAITGYSTNHRFLGYSYVWIAYDPSLTVDPENKNPPFAEGKQVRAQYNNTWKSFSSYRLIGFLVQEGTGFTTPNQVAENLINNGNLSDPANFLLFLLPEKTLSNFRKTLVSQNTSSTPSYQNHPAPLMIANSTTVAMIESCRAIGNRFDRVKSRCVPCPSNTAVDQTGFFCTKSVPVPAPVNSATEATTSPQITTTPAPKSRKQGITAKSTHADVSDSSVVSIDTPQAPIKKVGWFRRIINWFK